MHFEKELVVAAYEKDISWLDMLPLNIKVTVYRKGTQTDHPYEIFVEKNIGRCVHSFFSHIYQRYDSLADLTYFIQDYPFDHWANLPICLGYSVTELQETATIQSGGYYGYNTKYTDITPSTHVGVGKIYECMSDGEPHHGDSGIDVNRYWGILFDGEPPSKFEFNPGGHFVLAREHAHMRSREFYKQVIDLLESEEIAPYNIERLENYIFNPKFKSKI